MDKYRIVEICPDIFEVQYRGWFGWNRAERGYDQTLRAARERLARIRRSFEWVPKVHA
jgi:hypothetical protein